MKLWDFVNDINGKQQNLMEGSENDQLAEKTYVPFIINKQFSYFPDTIMYAQEMNRNHLLTNKQQYLYYLNTIRPRKRFSKWAKRREDEDLEMIRKYFGFDNSKAEQALTILTPEQLDDLRKKFDQGGT